MCLKIKKINYFLLIYCFRLKKKKKKKIKKKNFKKINFISGVNWLKICPQFFAIYLASRSKVHNWWKTG